MDIGLQKNTVSDSPFTPGRASDMALMVDSASILEEQMAEAYPEVFNAEAYDKSLTPEQSMDYRSTLRVRGHP